METSLQAVGPPGAQQWVPSWNGDPERSLAVQLLASREFPTNACISDGVDTTIISPLARLRQIEESRSIPLATTEYGLAPRPYPVPAMVARDAHGPTQNNVRLESYDRIPNYEWEKRKREIEHLYVDHSFPLPGVMAAMERKGFRASQSMYKRKFQKWGWTKYVKSKTYCQQYSGTSANRLGRGGHQWDFTTSACTKKGCTVPQNNSQAGSIQLSRPSKFQFTGLKAVLQTETDRCIGSILHHTKSLYIGSLSEGKWNGLRDDGLPTNGYIDFITGVRMVVYDLSSSSTDIGIFGLERVFKSLAEVVRDCDLHSLPAIWQSWMVIIEADLLDLGEEFLVRALQLSRQRFGSGHPLAKVLNGFCELQRTDPDLLKIAIIRAYRSCTCHLENVLTLSHPATLEFWAAYMRGVWTFTSDDVKKTLVNLRYNLQISEEENGTDDDYTLGFLDSIRDVLRTSGSDAEAEATANDIISRVNRRLDSGEKLEGILLVFWQNANYELGWCAKMRGDTQTAIWYLENVLTLGINDDHDVGLLCNLEAWYDELGDEDLAASMKELRIGGIYALNAT